MSEKIHFIFTGGTIDKVYDRPTETPIMSQDSVIPEFLKNTIEVNFEFTEKTICMIDSVDMTDEIRQTLAENIIQSDVKNIVVTHGTSTMEETATFLEKNLPKDHGKTIAMTAAMEPLSFRNSDGAFNLGCAITASATLPAGIYICIHGKSYKPGEITKNVQKAHFEEK